MSAIREAVAAHRDMVKALGANPGSWLTEEFLLRVGVEGKAQARPKRYQPGTPKHCFHNSGLLVGRTRGKLRYCEGLAIRPSLGFPMAHAWALDADNNVIDVTWTDPEECQYLGYPISHGEWKAWTNDQNTSVLKDQIGCVNMEFMLHYDPGLAQVLEEHTKKAVDVKTGKWSNSFVI